MKKSAKQLDQEIATSLRRRQTRQAKYKPRSPREIRTHRLETLRAIMEDVYDDQAWRDTDLEKLESWISVDDELSDREWFDTAKNQLVDQSVQPEHAGAAPTAVYQWGNIFISTYKMHVARGMAPAEAVDAARRNAFEEVPLTPQEAAQIKDDPKHYRR